MKRLFGVFFRVGIVSFVGFVSLIFMARDICASINFANYNGHIVLNKNSDRLVLTNAQKVTGWSEFSIVKNFGPLSSDTWRENYPSSFVLSPGGSILPTNNLVISNSNAIACASTREGFSGTEKENILEHIRNTSNAFTYCCKNSSNSLRYGIKNNSNVLLLSKRLVRTNSNAFVYCCKNTSNALAYNLKNNSNTVVSFLEEGVSVIDEQLWRTNSNAFVYCCKNSSNAFKHAIKIYDDHKIYTSDSTEQNYVFFKNGFTIGVHKTLVLNTPVPVTGNINLQDLGIIELQNDLYLGSNAYLTNGGIIDGNGYSLVLSCSFSIPENKQLHIVSDTIINGHGTTLYLEPHARIVVDNNVTLTLKNIRIKNTRNNLANPIIRPTGHRARVALQDVEFALADDFIFRDGQLFIHDDVLVTGSSKFSYRSSQVSYICDSGTLGFDKNTTFFYYPCTPDNSLINLHSKTASIYLDGATLLTTHTGMRLSKGMLCLDNNVTLSSVGQTLFSNISLSPITSRTCGEWINSVAWSPDGKYVAIGGEVPESGHDELEVYRFDGLHLSTNPIAVRHFGYAVRSVAWSLDGKYLAIGGHVPTGDQNEVQVYSFDGSNLSVLPITTRDYGLAVRSVAWSPDGKYLAVGGSEPTVSSDEIQVYRFDG